MSEMSRSDMEIRRLQAVELLKAGKSSQSDVAKAFGVSRTTASRWMRKVKAGADLHLTRATGRPRKITAAQESVLRDLWNKRDERWTQQEFRDAIAEWLGVSYDPDHVGRIIRRLGLRKTRHLRRAGIRIAPSPTGDGAEESAGGVGMSVMTVTTRIDQRYLMNKTKSELARMYLDLCDDNQRLNDLFVALRDGIDALDMHCEPVPKQSSWRYVVDRAIPGVPVVNVRPVPDYSNDARETDVDGQYNKRVSDE